VDHLAVCEPSNRERLIEEVGDAIDDFAYVEETVLHPAVLSKASLEARSAVSEGADDLRRIREHFSYLAAIGPDAEGFLDRCRRLGAILRDHVRSEEGRLLPLAERVLGGDDLADLGRRLASARSLRRAS
jgi:hypothetical protein